MTHLTLELAMSPHFNTRECVLYRAEWTRAEGAPLCAYGVAWVRAAFWPDTPVAETDFRASRSVVVFDGPTPEALHSKKQVTDLLLSLCCGRKLPTELQAAADQVGPSIHREAPWLMAPSAAAKLSLPEIEWATQIEQAFRQVALTPEPEFSLLCERTQALWKALDTPEISHDLTRAPGMQLLSQGDLVSALTNAQAELCSLEARIAKGSSSAFEVLQGALAVLVDQLREMLPSMAQDPETCLRAWLAMLPARLHVLHRCDRLTHVRYAVTTLQHFGHNPQVVLQRCFGPIHCNLGDPISAERGLRFHLSHAKVDEALSDLDYLSEDILS